MKTGTKEWSTVSKNIFHGCKNDCKYCVSSDTLVLMQDGTTQEIKELKIGDKIIGCRKKNNRMHFEISTVKNKWVTKKPMFKIKLENGVNLKSSADHKWYTNRGWRQVAIRTRKHWRHKLTNNSQTMSSLGFLYKTPKDSMEYYRGYLYGAFSGDGTIGLYYYAPKRGKKQCPFRFAANDKQMVEMVKLCLNKILNVEVDYFQYTSKMIGIRSNKIKNHHKLQFFLTRFNPCPNQLNKTRCKTRARGFLAGIFDAEGSSSNGTIRIHNKDENLLRATEKALNLFDFKCTRDIMNKSGCQSVRILGGLPEYIRFFNMVHPRITRKFKIAGLQFKKSSNVKTITKRAFANMELIDIETTTGNFIANGCLAHNCYARANAIRFKQINISEEWKNMTLNERALEEKPHLLKGDGRIMFPSTHDIFPEHLDITVEYLKKWLEQGNKFLIVSKPRFEVIKRLCNELEPYKEQIVFRFTIGSLRDDILKFWEPDAPSFEERMRCLRWAYENGYQTSVSCEPFFDNTIFLLIDQFMPYVTDSIWIGKMNGIKQRVNTDGWSKEELKNLTLIEKIQGDEMIKSLYEHFKTNPKIRWKDSIKKIVGLPEEEIG